jgi:hypothetical protein
LSAELGLREVLRGRARKLIAAVSARAIEAQCPLQAARSGDHDADAGLVEPHRRESTRTATGCSARCTTPRTRSRTRWLRAWRSNSRFDGDRPLRPWLYRTATNACLDALARRPPRGFQSSTARPPRGRRPRRTGRQAALRHLVTRGNAAVRAVWKQRSTTGLKSIAPTRARTHRPKSGRSATRSSHNLQRLHRLLHSWRPRKVLMETEDVVGVVGSLDLV